MNRDDHHKRVFRSEHHSVKSGTVVLKVYHDLRIKPFEFYILLNTYNTSSHASK